jgi:Tubulin-tyrosine ligase family
VCTTADRLGPAFECTREVHAGLNNIWIVKPAGKSRGRGIALFNSATALLHYVRASNDAHWVAQKYIEPLLIRGRKFDIRQWVLVTDCTPLAAWFYGDCYLRFAAAEYSTVDLSVAPHLSNNSITKGVRVQALGVPLLLLLACLCLGQRSLLCACESKQ